MTSPVALRRSHLPTLLAVLGLLLLLAPTPHARGQAGPIAHWKFDEVSGPTAFDSASTNHGTLSAAGATFVPGGISGNAMSLDQAANGLVNMGNVLSLTNGDHSIVAWVKTSPGNVTVPLVVVGKHQSGTRNGYMLMLNGSGGGLVALGKTAFYQGGSGIAPLTVAETPISTTSVNDGNWHQIVMVLQVGGTKRIYVDGAPAEDAKPTQAFNPNTAAFLIGGSQAGLVPTASFTGLIDDVQIYDRALTDPEIDLLFRNPGSEAKTAPVTATGPIAHWKFDEVGGTTAFDSAGTNHGTLSATGATFVPGGMAGNAMSLDKAANGLVNMGNNLMLGSSDFTVSGWIKTAPGAAPGFGTFVSKHEANTANGYFLSYDHTVIANGANHAFFYAGTRTIPSGGFQIVDVPVSTSSVNDGNWHHILGVYRPSGTTTIYVDGAPLEGSIASSPIAVNAAAFLIGGANVANVPTAFFTGLVDDVQIYDRALADTEIDFLFRNPGSEAKTSVGACSPPPNMIAWWQADGNANDSVGNNHGLNIGGVTYAPGKRGMAFSFSGSGTDYIEVPANPTLDFATNGPITIELWAYRTGTNASVMHLLGKRVGCLGAGGGDTANYQMFLNRVTLQQGLGIGGVGPANIVTTGLDLPGNVWTHLVGTFDGSNYTFYLNGQSVATATGPLGAPNAAPLRIGTAGDCFQAPFSGLLDDIALYNRALTAAEVQALFFAGGDKCQLSTSSGITSQPADSTVTAGTTATFSVGVSGTPPIGYQWTYNGINLPGATANSVTIPNASFTNAGTYAVRVLYPSGSVMSGNATLTVFYPLPVITSLPPSQTATLGGSVAFSVTATGPGPLSYLWRKGGVNIPGATNSNFGLAGIQATDAGDYQAVVSNPGGAVVSSNIVLSIAGAPVITTQPAGQVITLGSAASFTVTASGTAPLTYQWRFNRANIPGETNATLAIASAQVSNVGLYDVVVSNLAGIARSVDAELRFIGGPVITSQPTGKTVPAGSNAVLTVGAVGDPTLTFQWRLNGIPIPGATGADLLFGNAQLTNSGTYSVQVANGLGAVLSSNAALTVAVPLAITQQPSNQVSTAGGSVQFGVGAVGTPPLTYQWRFNGSDLPGETSGSLLLRTLLLTQSGGYSVVVRDAFNSVTSSVANLLVAPALPSVVLFDGRDTLKWMPLGGTGAVAWPIIAASNALEVAVGAGGIQSTQTFTDFNLHLEFRTPSPTDANRGNSGILLQNRYEIQIFESFGRAIAGTNDCGAILGQQAPRANATLAAGEWQTYDITFHAAQFNGTNKVANARVTVILNGVTVQDDVSITGPTVGGGIEQPLAGPIVLTDDGSRVQFRNIRVTPLDAAPDFAWVRAEAGRNANGLVRGLRVDRRGNVYATGTYDGTPTFGATNLTSLPGSPISTFVAKYDFTGNLLWVRGSGTASPCKALDLEIDTAGSVYVTGVLTRPDTVFGVAFGGGVNAAQDSYVAKFDTDGHLLWITATDGPGDSYAGNIAVDTAGNSYFVGSVGQSKTLGSLSIPSGGAYTAKLDPSGVPLWFHADSGAVANGVALNHLNEVLVTGYFQNQGTIGGVRFNLPRSDQGIFLEKLSNGGVPIWVKVWSATASFFAEQIAVDTTDNIVITGKFQGTATFGTNVLGTDTVAAFTAKCDRAGNLTWVRQIDNSGDTRFRGSVATDGANNIYVGLTPFDAVQTGTATLPGFGGNDALVVKYTSTGTVLWAVEAGGGGNDIGRAVAVDVVGNVYMGGEFSGVATFGTTNVISRGAADIFVAKLGNTPLPVDAGAQQAPYIVIQPADVSTIVDAGADFIAIAGGSSPLSYQWRLDGTDVPGATNAFLILNAVQFTNAGVYTLSVTNAFGAVVSSNAVLTVLGVPVVILHPQDQQLYVGEDLNLRVAAAGTPPLSYLWRFNGVNIPGGTNATLLVSNVTTNEAGEYFVIVANPAGVALSQKAFVTVNPAPFIRVSPQDQNVALGSTAMFGVQLLGQPPFTYQWLFNRAALPGQTGATLTLAGVQPAQEGRYSVAVTNAFGGVVSSEAQLTVIRPAFTFGRATDGSGGLALTFPPEATGFVLESSPTLGAGAVWTVVTNLATLPNGQIILPIDPTGGPRYFRLRTP